jgi:hypothetical protein
MKKICLSGEHEIFIGSSRVPCINQICILGFITWKTNNDTIELFATSLSLYPPPG